jgi:signal transduction histidine kinase
MQRVDVGVLAEEVRRQLEEMAVTRGVVIRIADGLPTVVTDPARIELILMNLVSNAIKYRDPNKSDAFVEISHRHHVARSVPEAPDRWTLVVADNGLGIAPEHQRSIFGRFVRAHAHMDSTLGVSGTGLGLSIVADCAEALGGSVACESQPQRGSTFAVHLPVIDAPLT